jgi:hypothetical protein
MTPSLPKGRSQGDLLAHERDELLSGFSRDGKRHTLAGEVDDRRAVSSHLDEIHLVQIEHDLAVVLGPVSEEESVRRHASKTPRRKQVFR